MPPRPIARTSGSWRARSPDDPEPDGPCRPAMVHGRTCLVRLSVVNDLLMGAVSASGFSEYAAAHQRRTTLVVGPVMLPEAGSALLVVLVPHGQVVGMPTRWIGLGLFAFIWVSTFSVQVPLHAGLAMRFNRIVCQRLVATNRMRTRAWTVRGIIALLLLG